MIYRITGGIAFVFIGLTYLGFGIPSFVTGVFSVIAGVALLASI